MEFVIVQVRADRDSKQDELDQLTHYYQADLDDRDMEIEVLQSKIIELSEIQAVLLVERDEAVDRSKVELQRSYHLSKQIENMKTEIEETAMESHDINQKYQELIDQVRSCLLYTSPSPRDS